MLVQLRIQNLYNGSRRVNILYVERSDHKRDAKKFQSWSVRYLFVKPLHDKIGTSLDKDANEWKVCPGNTWWKGNDERNVFPFVGKNLWNTCGREKILSTYHMLVNLIGYNRYVVTSGYIENVKCVILAKHGTARIRRIIYNDRCRRFVDLWFQII